MAKYLYLLEDVYVIMYELRKDVLLGNPNDNLGLHCDICFKKNENYYWLDDSCLQLKRIKHNKYFDDSGKAVALIPVSDTNDGYFHKDLPYVGGKSIDVKTETMNGKTYISADSLFILKSDYNLRLEKGLKDEIKFYKEQIRQLKRKGKESKKSKARR